MTALPSLCLARTSSGFGLREEELGRCEAAGGSARSCSSFRQGRLPSRQDQDGIRFPSAESSSQVYKSQPPPPLLSVFPPTHTLFTVLFSWLQKSPLLSCSFSLPPSFFSLPCLSLSEGTGRQVDGRAVTVGYSQGRIKVKTQASPANGMWVVGGSV